MIRPPLIAELCGGPYKGVTSPRNFSNLSPCNSGTQSLFVRWIAPTSLPCTAP